MRKERRQFTVRHTHQPLEGEAVVNDYQLTQNVYQRADGSEYVIIGDNNVPLVNNVAETRSAEIRATSAEEFFTRLLRPNDAQG